MVKITVFREDNQPVLHLQRRQSASASHFEKTIVPVLKKTILLEKTILPFPRFLTDKSILNFKSKLKNILGLSHLYNVVAGNKSK